MYRCAGCGADLFGSDTKFDSGTGWPSFTEPAVAKNVVTEDDFSTACAASRSTAPAAAATSATSSPTARRRTGLRYCINRCALEFEDADRVERVRARLLDASPASPAGADRRLRGLERRRRRRHRRPPATCASSGTPSRSPRSIPRTSTTSPRPGRGSSWTTSSQRADRVAGERVLARPVAGRRARRDRAHRHRAAAAVADLLRAGRRRGPGARRELVVTLGALLAEVAHSRPVAVVGTAYDAEIAEDLGLRPSSYQGPTGIVGVLHDECRQAGLSSASLWAAVPTYVPVARRRPRRPSPWSSGPRRCWRCRSTSPS